LLLVTVGWVGPARVATAADWWPESFDLVCEDLTIRRYAFRADTQRKEPLVNDEDIAGRDLRIAYAGMGLMIFALVVVSILA
jgi:hypothetical protein